MENLESISYDELKRITDNFSEERKIGQGAFGKVYKGTHNSGEIAVKVLHNYIDIDNQLFEQEFNNIWRLRHQNIVRLIGYCSQVQRAYVLLPSGRYGFADQEYRALCFEYMQNGSLEKHLREYDRLEWHTAYKIIKDTCEGLKYIHEECNMLHLDLKPDNILLDSDMVVKIADFGLSRIVSDKNTIITQTLCGTPGYMAPELILHGIESRTCDIFSLGVVIIKIAAGPENTSLIEVSPTEFIDRAEEKWKSELQATCSDPLLVGEYCKQVRVCTEIALECVNYDRSKRPNILDIISKMDGTEVAINKCRQLCVLTEDEIMSVLGVEGTSPAAQAAMIASLRQATRDSSEVRRQLCTQRLVDALEPMLLSDEEAGMQVNAIVAVVNLSLEAENKVRIRKSNVLSSLVEVLSSGHPEARDHATRAMYSLAMGLRWFLFLISDAGAIPPLVELFAGAAGIGYRCHLCNDEYVFCYPGTFAHAPGVVKTLLATAETRDDANEADAARLRRLAVIILAGLAIFLEHREAMSYGSVVEDIFNKLMRNSFLVAPGSVEEDCCVIMLYCFTLDIGGYWCSGLAREDGFKDALQRVADSYGPVGQGIMRVVLDATSENRRRSRRTPVEGYKISVKVSERLEHHTAVCARECPPLTPC